MWAEINPTVSDDRRWTIDDAPIVHRLSSIVKELPAQFGQRVLGAPLAADDRRAGTFLRADIELVHKTLGAGQSHAHAT